MHQFCQALKKIRTKENWFLFSASRCTITPSKRLLTDRLLSDESRADRLNTPQCLLERCNHHRSGTDVLHCHTLIISAGKERRALYFTNVTACVFRWLQYLSCLSTQSSSSDKLVSVAQNRDQVREEVAQGNVVHI